MYHHEATMVKGGNLIGKVGAFLLIPHFIFFFRTEILPYFSVYIRCSIIWWPCLGVVLLTQGIKVWGIVFWRQHCWLYFFTFVNDTGKENILPRLRKQSMIDAYFSKREVYRNRETLQLFDYVDCKAVCKKIWEDNLSTNWWLFVRSWSEDARGKVTKALLLLQ